MAVKLDGVAHRDNEDRSRSIDRQDLMFLRQLPRDQLDDGFIDFKLIQVNGRHPIVLAHEFGEIFLSDHAELGQV